MQKKTAESSLINFLQVNIFLVGTGRCNIMKLIVYSAERLNGTRCVNFFTLRHVVISLRHSIMKNSNRNRRRLTSTPKSSGCYSLRWSRNFHDIQQGSRSVRLMVCPGNTALLFLRGFEFSSNFFLFCCAAGLTWQNGRPWSFLPSAFCNFANRSAPPRTYRQLLLLTSTVILCGNALIELMHSNSIFHDITLVIISKFGQWMQSKSHNFTKFLWMLLTDKRVIKKY